ncbi:MAG: cell division protein ZipA C-terminal FtsZ-binding domain-containing protein [Pseudomonadota bacterium]
MSTLQWALLIIAIIVVVAIYVMSRREKRVPVVKDWTAARPPIAINKPPAGDQMEIFSRTGDFDEFGVGRPRRRVPPTAGGMPGAVPLEESADPATFPGVAAAPAPAPAAPVIDLSQVKVAVPVAAPKVVEQKILAILIAEREGGVIMGNNLHRALRKEALVFGDRKIYHRMDLGQPVFSVAGLLKPGQLDPAEAESFTTPGLTAFMVLPGPASPVDAVRDLLNTAKELAKSLKGELFDNKRQPFTEASERAMLADVEEWARRNA